MNFTYIALDSIIDEAIAEMRQLYRQGEFVKDDVYNWMIEAAKLVCGNNYEESSTVIEIKKHSAFIPKSFVSCSEMWQVEEVSNYAESTLEAFHIVGNKCYNRKSPLRPGDSASVRLSSDKAKHPQIQNAGTYVFKVPPGYVRTSFASGFIGMKYMHLPVNEEGIIMVQDEVNNLLALKNYSKKMALEPGYMMGEVAKHIYDTFENAFYVFLSQAKAIQKFPDPKDIDHHAEQLRQRYNAFNMR